MPTEDLSLVVKLLHMYPYIALICGCLAWYRRRGRIRRRLNSWLKLQSVASTSRTHPNPRRARAGSASDEIIGNSTAVANPSTSGLRNRTLKSNSTIWKAAEEGDVEEIERHIDSGVDINAYSPALGTPLSVAAQNGNSDVVTWLLSRRAKVNGYYMGYQETALHSAAERGHETVVLSLLEHGAEINAQVSGLSAIYFACLKGHWTSLQILVEFGADERVSLNPTISMRTVFGVALKCAFSDSADTTDKRKLDELATTCGDRGISHILDPSKTTISKQWQCIKSHHPFRSKPMDLISLGCLMLELVIFLPSFKHRMKPWKFLNYRNNPVYRRDGMRTLLKEACELQLAISK